MSENLAERLNALEQRVSRLEKTTHGDAPSWTPCVRCGSHSSGGGSGLTPEGWACFTCIDKVHAE